MCDLRYAAEDAELKRVLTSRRFSKQEKPKALLNFLVNQVRHGVEVTHRMILTNFYGMTEQECDKNPDENKGRQLASNLRKDLRTYYEEEGADDPIEIRLPDKGYQIEFVPREKRFLGPVAKPSARATPPEIAPVQESGPATETTSALQSASPVFDPLPAALEPVLTAPGGTVAPAAQPATVLLGTHHPPHQPADPGKINREIPQSVKTLIGGFAAAALTGILWLVYHRPCHSYVSVDPILNGKVDPRFVVQTTRIHTQWFCACRDYIVVQPVKYDQWWIQGALADGDYPSQTANFGEFLTKSGTQYTVFVLTTGAELKCERGLHELKCERGLLVRAAPLRGEDQSQAVQVTLR